MANYRKIWEDANGPIPKDKEGRSYEIHHIDGDRTNNDLSNLICISIEEHYKIHLDKKEYYSANLIADRFNRVYVKGYKMKPRSKEHSQKISKALKGRPTGRKGSKLSQEHIERLREVNTGKVHSEETKKKIGLAGVGRVPPNKGKKASKETIEKLRYPKTQEHKDKIAKSLTGRKNPEHSKKMKGRVTHNAKSLVFREISYRSYLEASKKTGISIYNIKKELCQKN